jgi:Resolvase, N terminal domain/Recombinase
VSGKHSDRPQLAAALGACKKHRAKLVIAKLDRLSRNLAFVATHQIQASGVQSLRGVARALAARGVKTARGGEWSAVQVADILRRHIEILVDHPRDH